MEGAHGDLRLSPVLVAYVFFCAVESLLPTRGGSGTVVSLTLS